MVIAAPLCTVKCEHTFDRLFADQRHVARQYQHIVESLQRFARLHDRVARPALLFLLDELNPGALHRRRARVRLRGR